MDDPDDDAHDLEDQVDAVLRLLNHDGGLDRLLALSSSEVEALANSVTGFRMADLHDQVMTVGRTTARGILVFSTLGWAFTRKSPLPAYESALEIWDRTGSIVQAEEALVDGWADNAYCKGLDYAIRDLVYPDHPLYPVYVARAELVRKAWDLHLQGHYEASIPIVLAQAEGVMQDTKKKTPFNSHDSTADDVIDDETLAGLGGSLSVARRAFAGTMSKSQVTGGVSRHAILHGRELGYDTRTNSAKAFAFLVAIVEFCAPVLGDKVTNDLRRQERQLAGADGADEQGRRLDRRGFADARAALNSIVDAQSNLYLDMHRFGRLDELDHTPSRSWPQVTVNLDEDGSRWWAWARSAAGWVFGLSDVIVERWEYEGPEPPTAGPWDSPGEWIPEHAPPPPNWLPEYPHYKAAN